MNSVVFLKSLADETRLTCLLLINNLGELCVCDLTVALDVSQPKISRHLAHLRKCNVVESRRINQWVYYRIHPELPLWAKNIIDESQKGANDEYYLSLKRLKSGESKSC